MNFELNKIITEEELGLMMHLTANKNFGRAVPSKLSEFKEYLSN